jgi:site-specific recombinase
MPEMAILVSETMRSQTASFVGNLVIVFPLTLGLAWLWNVAFGFPLADPQLSQSLLDQQNPLTSLSLLYACFTGVFLYLSGIISGFFDNKAIYGNIPQRLREHPGLKRSFSKHTIDKLANYAGRHLGGIMGNLCLGFFLGTAGFIGYIFGVSFDIRHITISTANFAIGLYGLDFEVDTSEIIWVTAGVLLIGFLNFFVSFALAFFTALASRRVKFKHYRQFFWYLIRLAFRYPFDFVRPPKTPRKVEDFITKKTA